MALGACHHALGPLVDAGDRLTREPGGEGRERLDRDVELAAEAAAAGARHNSHLLRRKAQDLGRHVPVHDRRLSRDEKLDAIAHPAGPAGLGLDVGVLDEGGLETPLGRYGGVRQRRLGVAALDPALDQLVALDLIVNSGRRLRAGLIQAIYRRLRLVVNGQIFVADSRHRLARADQRHHGVAPVAHDALGQHRLVAKVGVDAHAVGGHVRGGEHPFHAGPGIGRSREIAEHDPGRIMGRTDDAEPERVLRHGVGAVALGAGELGNAVELGKPGAHGGTRRGRTERLRGIARRIQHRRHDLAVAGAAAEHAAEAVHDLCRAGAGRGAQHLGRGDQHAGRAGAALRRAMAQERPLKAVQAAVSGEALHGLHAAARSLGQRHHAAAHLGAVEQHRAGAAVAGVAAHLGPGEAEIVAQRVGEAAKWRRAHRHRPSVDQERDAAVSATCVHIMLPSSASVREVSVRAASKR